MSRDKQIVFNTHKRLYKVWLNMKQRCYNPKNDNYYLYGKRGIKICEEWKNSFSAFEEWALKNGYNENAPRGQCTIDRIENDKGYSPDNCKWVTIGENANNKRTCLMYDFGGKKQSLANWARELGIDYNALLSRMHRNGFNFEEAIIPRKNGSRHLDYEAFAELKKKYTEGGK